MVIFNEQFDRLFCSRSVERDLDSEGRDWFLEKGPGQQVEDLFRSKGREWLEILNVYQKEYGNVRYIF